MHHAVLILGGNTGDVTNTFKNCLIRFRELGYELFGISSVYTSNAWGFESDNLFYNQVVVVETKNNPQQVLTDCLSIENKLGRTRTAATTYSDRDIDIDILFFDQEIIEEDHLFIPHPRLHLRKFCLVPLVEIMPDFVHPKLDKTMRTLLTECEDESKINQQ